MFEIYMARSHTAHTSVYLALTFTIMSENPPVKLKKTVISGAHSVWFVICSFILLPNDHWAGLGSELLSIFYTCVW